MTDDVRLIVDHLAHGYLIEENRVERARRLLGPDYPEELFQQLITPPIANHKYLEWMAKQLKGKGAAPHMVQQLKDYVRTFDENPRHFRQQGGGLWQKRGRDINRWTGDELTGVAKRAKVASEVESKPLTGFTPVLDNDQFWIGMPQTHYASVWFAHYFHPEVQARWCSAAYDTDQHFRGHKEQNITYIWDKQGHEKYAVIPNMGVWDSENTVRPCSILNRIIGPQLKEAIFPVGSFSPEIKKKAEKEGLDMWLGGLHGSKLTGADLVSAYSEKFQREPDDQSFRQFVRMTPAGVKARMEAVYMVRAKLKGEPPEEALQRFRAKESALRANFIADFITSPSGSYRKQLKGVVVPQGAA